MIIVNPQGFYEGEDGGIRHTQKCAQSSKQSVVKLTTTLSSPCLLVALGNTSVQKGSKEEPSS